MSTSVFSSSGVIACNMCCRYCFYARVSAHREVKSHGVMQSQTMRFALIDRALGPARMRRSPLRSRRRTRAGGGSSSSDFTRYVSDHRINQTIHYALQTNGYLVDKEWAEFFHENNFLVGVSLDGYRDLHNWLRPDSAQEGTYDRVMHAIELLRAAQVDFNVLTVLTAQLAKHPQKVYKFYRQHKLDYVQLIPCLPGFDDEEGDEFSLTPEAFASFYKAFFRLWTEDFRRGHYMSVTLFDNVIPLFRGYPPQQCGMLGRCAPQFVVESNGDVYPCDFYVLDQYRCGNVQTDSLEDMAT